MKQIINSISHAVALSSNGNKQLQKTVVLDAKALGRRLDNIREQNQKYTSLEDKIQQLNLSEEPFQARILAIAQNTHYDKDGFPVSEAEAKEFLKNPLVFHVCMIVDSFCHSR